MRIEGVVFGVLCGVLISTGPALADLFEVKEAVEEALCRKSATDYANDPSSLTVHAIAQLQICLAETLKGHASTAVQKKFDIQSPRSSISIGETTHPTPPTPPTPPKSLKIR